MCFYLLRAQALLAASLLLLLSSTSSSLCSAAVFKTGGIGIVGSRTVDTVPLQTPTPSLDDASRQQELELRRRATSISTELSTCGYLDGDPEQSRTANSGFDCRVDTQHGLWGFCPTTVISATDCGLAANCVDSHACTSGCGITGVSGLTTFHCTGTVTGFCSTALLTFGVDQTYSYIACGATNKIEHLLISPTAASSSSTSSKPTSSPKITSTSLTSSKSSTSSSSDTAASQTSRPTTTPSPTPSPSPNTTGEIIGGVIGGLALVCIFAVVIVYLLRRDAARPGGSALPWRRRGAGGGAGGADGRGAYHDGYALTAKDTPPNMYRQGGWGPAELHAEYVAIKPDSPPVELPASLPPETRG